MLTFSQMMLAVTVFAFMLTVVNLLPAVLTTLQERYKDRLGGTNREIDKFFVHLKVTHIILGSLGVGGAIAWLTQSWVLGIAIALGGIFAPKIVMSVWKTRRAAQLDEQLMDALILINNAMRSGLDIATGIELVVTNLKPPISEEFGLVLNAYRLGTPLESALQEMAKRVKSRILDTTITAILIQRETGGNLVKTFEQLVQTIREESKLQKKITAISSQGRTQIAFLAVFPWVLAAVLYALSPEMIQPALAEPMGQLVVVVLVIWEVVGVMVTKNIVTVDV